MVLATDQHIAATNAYIDELLAMDKSLLLGQTRGDEDPPSTTNPTMNTPVAPITVVGSPLTPMVDVDISTPNEPCQRRLLVKCFKLSIDDGNEVDLYDSDGNEPPVVDNAELNHFEDSLDDALSNTMPFLEQTRKFVFLTDDAIDSLKVDELKLELKKRILSKTGKKPELRERMKSQWLIKL